MKYLFTIGVFSILVLSSCQSSIGPYTRYVDSTSFIDFTLQGKQFHIRDWVGGEAMPSSILGWYGMIDSTFSFHGSDSDPNAAINFLFRSAYDTLSSPLIDNDSLPRTSVLTGIGQIILPTGTYTTDSLHRGSIKITQIGTLYRDNVNAVFHFSAIKVGGTLADTIRVENGVITNLHLDYVKK